MSAKGSELKRVRQSRKANSYNNHYKTMMKTSMKKVLSSTSKEDASPLKDEAFKIIDKLSNKTHSVISGLSLFYDGKAITIFDKTDVTFKKLSKSIIENYIESFNVLDKAGAYNIEDAENILIKHIDGCYNNIVGFPLKKFKMSKIKTILDNL